jgi:hypothetical protein
MSFILLEARIIGMDVNMDADNVIFVSTPLDKYDICVVSISMQISAKRVIHGC